MLSIKIKDIHLCQDIEHVYAIVRISPWVTHVLRAGDLVPVGTMLVTSGTMGTVYDTDSQ